MVRAAWRAQQAQTTTQGYFTGYLHKAQPIGLYELKKCIDKQHVLRERLHERSASQRDQALLHASHMRTQVEPCARFAHACERDNFLGGPWEQNPSTYRHFQRGSVCELSEYLQVCGESGGSIVSYRACGMDFGCGA